MTAKEVSRRIGEEPPKGKPKLWFYRLASVRFENSISPKVNRLVE